MRESEMHDDGAHPDLDRWIAYRAGDLSPEDEETLQNHLVECRNCTTLVLDLEAFADSTTADAAAEWRTAEWRTADARTADARTADAPAVSKFEKAAVWSLLRPHLRRRRWHVPAALAASFLAAVLGGGLWLQQREVSGLRQRIAELSTPEANAPVYDLFPRAALRGEAGRETTLAVPAGARTLLLILSGVDAGADTVDGLWRAEILDAGGRPVADVEGLVMDEMGVFTFALPRAALAAGDHVVRLWGPGAGETPVAEYPLRIVYR